jgi:hypothetical protein
LVDGEGAYSWMSWMAEFREGIQELITSPLFGLFVTVMVVVPDRDEPGTVTQMVCPPPEAHVLAA